MKKTMRCFGALKERFLLKRELRKFRECNGYPCDLEEPGTYNEKITWRKIFDRNPVFPIIADKLRAREYVVENLGEEAEQMLIPILYTTKKPSTIPFDNLGASYIIKANHGSGWVIPVMPGSTVNRLAIVKKCRKWLRSTYGQKDFEWAYRQIRPKIFVEKLLLDESGEIPPDWKFYVFEGKAAMVYFYSGRFGDPSEAFFDRDFRKIKVGSKCREAVEVLKPSNFESMVEISEHLARPFDFLRVDLYNVHGRIFFGEFTLYPASGRYRYPSLFDRWLGDLWKLDKSHAREFPFF